MQTTEDLMAILFKQVSKQFKQQWALKEVSFSVQTGEVFALIGGNGAGKSTLMKILLDFIQMKQGQVDLFGAPSVLSSSRDCLAYLPERFVPPGWMRAGQFIKTFASIYGASLTQAELERACEVLHLDVNQLKKPIHALSKGMTQKIGLLSVFLSQKPLLVLDEPMSGLDPLARVGVKQLMTEAKAAGTTLFYSSHLLADVEEVCDRVAILHEGTLCFTGTLEACLMAGKADTLEQAYLNIVKVR